MRTFASTAVMIVVLACSGCGGNASTGKEPGARTSTLPAQFHGPWKVQVCPNLANEGTGLDVADVIEIEDVIKIEERLGFKITLANQTVREPDPTLLQHPELTLVRPVNGASQNVLTSNDVGLLCAAGPRGFISAFRTVLAKHSFELTYLYGVSALHRDHPEQLTLIVFLPYALDEDHGSRFFLAVVSLSEPHTHIRNHNGIVHGYP